MLIGRVVVGERQAETFDHRKDGHPGMLVGEGIEGKVIISAVVRPIHHLKKEAPRDTLPTIRRHDTPFGAIERPLVLAIANLKSGGRARYGSEEDHQILACERIDDAILLRSEE